ncbi:BON domain-containing protein [Verticiella sediminum]|uniref:BON domain-containing protein n=1 Tax=Verticiella sediminum TaxID=1247510 RepID=A0A556AFC4_9BURK|nr:BON domain-containing protein [Verticiella sediminum]TSH91585.1 BON domain-containing protein [Verticiella sediminum]
MNTRPFSLALFLALSATALSIPTLSTAANTERPVGERMREGAHTVGEKVKEGAGAVGEYASDATITGKVKTAFVANENVKALDVSVETKDRIVYLTGAVETPEQSATAERLASEVKDVRSVVNHLTLKTNR